MKFKLLLAIFSPLFVFNTISNNHIDILHEELQFFQKSYYSQSNTIIVEKTKSENHLTQNYSDELEDPIQSVKAKKPTKTPKPTPPPLIIPPPADQKSSNIIIFLGILTVIIITVGVWINRKKLE